MRYLIVLGVVVILGWVLYYTVSNKMREVSKGLFGTENFVEGLNKISEESNNTPYSVSGGNSLYLPRIHKDFPDYHQTTMEEKVKEFMLLYFESVEKKEIAQFVNTPVTSTVRGTIQFEITDLIDKGNTKKYDNIKIHSIAIYSYTKTTELATVRYQISLESIGNKGKEQSKYEVEVTYLFEDMDKESFSMRCSHCGGSLKENSLVCEYCDTLVVRNISKVWVISNFKKLK